MRHFPGALWAGFLVLALGAAGCGGGGGGSVVPASVGSTSITATSTPTSTTSTPPQMSTTSTPTSTATPTLAPTSTNSIVAGAAGESASLSAIGAGYTGEISVPATTNGSGAIALTFSSTLGSSTPTISSVKRIRQTIGVALTGIVYVSVTPATTLSFANSPAFSFTLPTGYTLPSGASTYIAFYDPTSPNGWVNLDGPGTSTTPGTYAFAANPVPMTFKAGVTYVFALYATSAVVAPLATPSPSPSPKPSPSPSPSLSPSPTPTPTHAAAGALSGPTYGPASAPGWGPVAVANQLQFPVQSGFDGTGTTIAIISNSGFNTSDLITYLAYFKSARTKPITIIPVDGASVAVTDNEATLDVETVAALAPGATIELYILPQLSSNYENDALEMMMSNNSSNPLPNVVSMSYAGCESAGNPTQSGTSPLFATGASLGIAFVAASGDQGYECSSGATTFATGVGYPASDPNVIGVGGTEVATASSLTTLTSTIAWNDTNTFGGTQEASGGGVSSVFPLPSYQVGLAGIASTTHRNVPDIAMPANDDAAYYNGAWTLLGGTSWSTPTFAAMLAGIDESCGSSLAGPAALYAAYGVASTAFIDVTSGNNQYGTTAGYSAGVGYDDVTGLGVPYGMPLAQAACTRSAVSSRARTAAVASARKAAASYVADATPHVAGLIDRGERNASALTRIQLVLNPASSASDEDAVTAALRASGFTVVRTFANHLVIDAQGPSAAIEGLFATRMHDVTQGSFGTHYLPATAITVPASLAPYVASVTLDDVITMRNVR